MRRGAGLAAELAKIAVGRSEVRRPRATAASGTAWAQNPAFKRLAQSYLAAGGTVDGLVDDAGLDWRAERRVRFAAENVVDALAPTNFPVTNPAVLKAVIDTGGATSSRRGALRARHGHAAADPVDGRPVGVRGRARTWR